MSDNITLPREVAEHLTKMLEECPLLPNGDWSERDCAALTALRARLAAPRLAVTVDPRLTPDEARAISSALAAPEPVLGLISDEVRAALKAADAVESQEAYRTRTPAAAPRPEPVAWMYVNSEGECEQIEYGTEAIDDDSITLLYAAPPAAAPEPESKTPAWWMDGLTATLMREGVNKHRAREIAVGYWEAYCQIEEDKT